MMLWGLTLWQNADQHVATNRTTRSLRQHSAPFCRTGQLCCTSDTALRLGRSLFGSWDAGVEPALPTDVKLTDSHITFTKKTQDTLFKTQLLDHRTFFIVCSKHLLSFLYAAAKPL